MCRLLGRDRKFAFVGFCLRTLKIRNEQLGDPDFGVNLHKTKFSKNTSLAKELATDGVLDSQKFVNNVLFMRDDVSVKKSGAGKIDIEIKAIFSESVNQRELVVIEGVSIDE